MNFSSIKVLFGRRLLLAALAPLAGLQAQVNYATPYTFTTLAGSALNAGSADGTGSFARFHSPMSVALDGDGYVYVADADNHTIRKVSPGGITTTLAGMAGVSGSSDGMGSNARFYLPQGLAVDSTGTVYAADSANHTIRKITPDGVVTTIAGSAGIPGSADGVGSSARFNYPFGLAADSVGNIFVADTGNHIIRKITPAGVVSTIAGVAGASGSADGRESTARFYFPEGVAVDQFSTLYIADSHNSTIRKITPAGNVTTFAGSALITGSNDGIGSVARFHFTQRIAVDPQGNVFVTDTGNGTIRMISPDGNVTTIAGTPGVGGSNDGVGSAVQFLGPYGIAVDGAGNVLVGDTQNQTIRFGTPPQVVNRVTISKRTLLVQTSPTAPAIDPKAPGPQYIGPYGFSASIHGTSLAHLSPPVITLAAGSQNPTQYAYLHNGGTLAYSNDANEWRYAGIFGFAGGKTEMELNDRFVPGTYGLTVLGTSFSLNLPTTANPANVPVVTLSGGSWVAGKYVIAADQALTLTSNAFVNFDQNADGAIRLQFEGMVDQRVSHSANPGADNFITTTIPAGSLVSGRDYSCAVSFIAVMDEVTVPALGASLNTAQYEMNTQFTISTKTTTQPGARATFYAIGDLSGGIRFSDVRDVAKVGGVLFAVGGATTYDGSTGYDTAYVWNSVDGMTAIPSLVPDLTIGGPLASVFASAITPDASYIAGRSLVNVAQHLRHAVRVTTNGLTNLDLGTLPTTSHLGVCGATSISADGSVMSGLSVNANGRPQMVRFTANGPTITAIPFLNVGDDTSSPTTHGTSADGSVMIGTSSNGAISGGYFAAPGNVAFRYVEGGGVSALPFLPGGSWNGTLYMNGSGNLALLFGDSPGFASGQPYLCNLLDSSTTALGLPAGYSDIAGGGMNANGSLVAVDFNLPSAECFVHNAAGWHPLIDMLARAGVTLSDWTLENAFGMSADGTLIWGRGIHNGNYEGWIIEFAPGYLASYGASNDFNSDDQSDILWENTVTGDRYVWLMNDTAFGAGVDLGVVATGWHIAATADFNSDGKVDILWENTVTGDRYIWLMNGTVYSSGASLGTISTDWRIAAAADFNGDGKPDILWENTVTGNRVIWFMDGTGLTSTLSLGIVSTDYHIVAAADFNADAKPDILFENTVTGDRYLWLMNGAAYSAGLDLGVVPTDWHIAAAADYNSDGRPDILWENTVTGDCGVWLMNGTVFSSWVDIGVVSTDWRIAN